MPPVAQRNLSLGTARPSGQWVPHTAIRTSIEIVALGGGAENGADRTHKKVELSLDQEGQIY